SVMAIDDAGNASPVSADTVTTNLDVRPATVSVCPSPTQAQTLTIAFRAGFGATAEDVPAPIRHALLMLIAHWFENREPVSFGQSASRIPDAVSDLLKPYRAVRL
ncbi:MAG: head-tail connector protein, partial [Pseudomonadota bacterium]